MPSPTLKIARGLSLPADLVTQTTAILARKGAGKTYTAMVMTEEMVKANLQVVALDPLGAWWGLRSSADGKKDGLPLTIIGGEHGDVPLEPTAGKVIAELVVEHGGSFIIDMSMFESNAAQDRFVTDFAERLYRIKAKDKQPLHLMVDEADSFAPQRPQRGQERMLGAFEAIVRRGRIRGLGVTMITQRPAVLNKNVLTQAECLMVLQMTSPQDRAAIDEWVRGNGTKEQRDELMASLASLDKGEAWFWSPSWLSTFQKVQVRKRETFDSSRTPEAGQTPMEPRSMAPVDLDLLRQRISDTIEKAEANDPKRLKKRIAELEREIKNHQCPEVSNRMERVEVPTPVLDEEQAARYLNASELIVRASNEMASAIRQAFETPKVSPIRQNPTPKSVRSPIVSDVRTPVSESGEIKLGKGERKVLEVLAQWPQGRTHNELAFLTGYSASSSSIGARLSKLRAAGLVEPGQPIRLTSEGMDAAGGPHELPTGEALLNHWRFHPKMGKGERAVLDVLVDRYPEVLTHEELCEATGYSPDSSSVDARLSNLRKLGLVEKGIRRASHEFMDSVQAS